MDNAECSKMDSCQIPSRRMTMNHKVSSGRKKR